MAEVLSYIRIILVRVLELFTWPKFNKGDSESRFNRLPHYRIVPLISCLDRFPVISKDKTFWQDHSQLF